MIVRPLMMSGVLVEGLQQASCNGEGACAIEEDRYFAFFQKPQQIAPDWELERAFHRVKKQHR